MKTDLPDPCSQFICEWDKDEAYFSLDELYEGNRTSCIKTSFEAAIKYLEKEQEKNPNAFFRGKIHKLQDGKHEIYDFHKGKWSNVDDIVLPTFESGRLDIPIPEGKDTPPEVKEEGETDVGSV